MKIREGNLEDLEQIKQLAITEWSRFQPLLTPENWIQLRDSLQEDVTYESLLLQAYSIVYETDQDEIIAFGFLVPSGNPTDIYNDQQCYIRFLTVSKDYSGQKIGEAITWKCIDKARENGEKYIALHTSEMMPAARHIYDKLGFTILKELPSRLGKKYWLYELAL